MPPSSAIPTPQPYPTTAPARHDSTLLNRNVWIGRRRTSLRLEPAMWRALEEVARNSGLTVHEVCTLIDQRRRESSLTAAVRVFLLSYYRDAVMAGCRDLGKTLVYRALRADTV